jgi:hypothetical protein
MGWLDANEYLLIAATAGDRIDELLSSTEIAMEAAAIAERRDVTEPTHVCDLRRCAFVHLPV